MGWSDRHETEDESDDASDDEDEQVLEEEFDEWVQEGNESGPWGRKEAQSEPDGATRTREGPRMSEDSSIPGSPSRAVSEDPLAMTQCPRCDSREFVSKKLVYEEFHYSEGGELDYHQNRVRAEFEYTCVGCNKRFHELPKGARGYYSEVEVLKQDLRRAIQVQVRTWLGSVSDRLRGLFSRGD
ncbi:hypothetical protein [Saliphagus infecundisoli]|uniref:Uncharacterized protein n=1 Tax=Saliphagus infecundisoli TaxID=1849069 RepID=A0ABD5Q981_9EURY|nr:hypothetical protein [Saliphagus infecundisoli]